ncbi:hypothetical protein [Actinophytocola gossypii]|uniref:Histidine kinase n=1 Tax=Actinophytocola gossypii TaxID=2812003 RepID=A0ABT2JFT4_9PSEU|nr:hypothetical protein [Actinophytocola gossypii]MCT2586731.1 hypothetical protein [Actinophytocola gossypii]
MTEAGRDLVRGNLMRALRLVVLTIATLLLVGFTSLLPLAGHDDGGVRQVVALALLAVVGVVAGAAVLRNRAVGRVRWVLVVAVFASAAVATAGIPGEQLMVRAEWCYVTIGWFLLLVLVDHGTVAAAAAIGVFVAASFGQLFLAGQGHQAADLVVVCTIALGCELPVLAVAMAVRRIAATAADAAGQVERVRTAEAIAEQVHADRVLRYTDTTTTIVPLLTGLTTGTANLDDGTRARYALAAARLRRLFAEHDEVPDPLLHELGACLDLAERNGVEVYLATCGEYPTPPLAVRRELTEPALRLVARADSEARVVVLGTPGRVAVSVLADDPNAESEPLTGNDVGVSVTRLVDGPRVWVEATWHTPS